MPSETSSPTVRRYTKAEVKRNRMKVVSGALGGLAAVSALFLLAPRPGAEPAQKHMTRDEATTCELSPETMEFTFNAGDGINSAVVAVPGSGNGEGDACFSETKEAVEHALHGDTPLAGQTIMIPKEVHPVQGRPGK